MDAKAGIRVRYVKDPLKNLSDNEKRSIRMTNVLTVFESDRMAIIDGKMYENLVITHLPPGFEDGLAGKYGLKKGDFVRDLRKLNDDASVKRFFEDYQKLLGDQFYHFWQDFWGNENSPHTGIKNEEILVELSSKQIKHYEFISKKLLHQSVEILEYRKS